jgi:hypothetical protein
VPTIFLRCEHEYENIFCTFLHICIDDLFELFLFHQVLHHIGLFCVNPTPTTIVIRQSVFKYTRYMHSYPKEVLSDVQRMPSQSIRGHLRRRHFCWSAGFMLPRHISIPQRLYLACKSMCRIGGYYCLCLLFLALLNWRHATLNFFPRSAAQNTPAQRSPSSNFLQMSLLNKLYLPRVRLICLGQNASKSRF